MRKEILLYGLIMAAVLITLKLLEASFLYRHLSIEYYLSIIAVVFLILGVWFGNSKSKSREVSQKINSEHLQKKLNQLGMSSREYEVICKLSEGLSNKEIGEALFLSENTIKTHLANIFSKLNAKRRTEVLKIARTEGIIN